ncbi:MAG: hypothetical protein AMQ22_00547 [Candidatus Methanofastidiosum methylothiophilum]|uniref:Uncharacterized protein n=1 Tax=Candidatus Methanofastidiosum methylothiophilum TaxID=1705564 RepID=A0A150J6H1_9EURY|nr:MAG: hypothetical protein AMQ22_00547 [Candidatus Methanofastidiosum methylthiophilus]
MKKIITSIIILFFGISLTMPMVFGTVTLYDVKNYPYDIDEKYGYLENGEGDAYDLMYYLSINGITYSYGPATYTTELDGRQIVLGVTNIGGLNVQRKIFVPLTENWARYLEIIHNPTGAPITANVRIYGNLGSDSSTTLISTSSTVYSPPLLVPSGGQIIPGPGNFWAVTDDYSDGGADPSLAHVWGGPKGNDHIDYARFYNTTHNDNLEYLWNNITIAPGQTVVIMHFAVQQTNSANAISEAKELYDNDGNLNHIMYASEPNSNDIQNIINWGARQQNKELPMKGILDIIKKNKEESNDN